MTVFSVFDAARDYSRVVMAQMLSRAYFNLFIGEKGERLSHVAPHLFECDLQGAIAHMALSGLRPGEVGFLAEAEEPFESVYKHFRRFLTVIRESDGKKVLFRFYDPRILRVFLPACNSSELNHFFGPIKAFHCQGEDTGEVLTFRLDGGLNLMQETTTLEVFFESRFGLNPIQVAPLPQPTARAEESSQIRLIKSLHLRHTDRILE